MLTELTHAADDLAAQAADQRPDLASAFADDGWVHVTIHDMLMTRGDVAFLPGDVALARPAVARHPGDFIVYSTRTATLAGLRHDEHFAFADDPTPA
ncbi:MAG TPA: hypothetical protein VGM33_26300 [Baekduia sp.]|jgi:hypothetical protein